VVADPLRALNPTNAGDNANANLADGFTKDTAAKTGQSERKVQLDATRAKLN